MTETSVHLQPSFILQQRKFRETSLIMDVLTRDFGLISILAKGVRKSKSKTAALLQPFIPLMLSFIGKAELKTLTTVESLQPYFELQGMALYSGFYINELLGYFLHKDDPHPEVFNDYSDCLLALSKQEQMEGALRNFELNLIENTGYGLQLNHDFQNESPINPLKNYAFDVERGPAESETGIYSGKTLHAMSLREFSDSQVLAEAKRLMRTVIDARLQGKALKSRAIINQLIRQSKYG